MHSRELGCRSALGSQDIGHSTSPPGKSPGPEITPSGPPVRQVTSSKLIFGLSFCHAIALLKLVFGLRGPVIHPLFQRSEAFLPPCLVQP